MITPYKRTPAHRELAYLVTRSSALDERGRERGLGELLERKVQVWGDAATLHALARAGHGSAVLWRYDPVGWHPDRDANDWPVRGLRIDKPDEPREVLRGLKRWRNWLESYGAAPAGSLGGSGMSLLRATLERPLWTSAGECPPINYTLGARQEAVAPTPRLIEGNLRHSDIVAAYANTLGRARYGREWNHFGPRDMHWRRLAERNPDVLVYVRAAVDVPELEFGPLPERPRKQRSSGAQLFWQKTTHDTYPTGRRIQGCWTWAELMQAELAGCRIVRVLDVWVHIAAEDDRPFARWLDAVHVGRDLGGFAGQLAKATGNATWGQLAVAKGRRLAVAKGRRQTLPMRGGNPSQRAFDLAEWITGSVRAQLYAGMRAVDGALVCAHTDGLWANGETVKGWRVARKRDADELRLMDAQCLSYRVRGGEWEYVVAGALDPAETFESLWQHKAVRGQVYS